MADETRPKVHCASKEQHVAGMGEYVCKRSDCPSEQAWETGYGLAGGGIGVYHYCATCEQIVEKIQDNEE